MSDRQTQLYQAKNNRGFQPRALTSEQELKNMVLQMYLLIENGLTHPEIADHSAHSWWLDLITLMADPEGQFSASPSQTASTDDAYIKHTAYYVLDLLQSAVNVFCRHPGSLQYEDYTSLGTLLGKLSQLTKDYFVPHKEGPQSVAAYYFGKLDARKLVSIIDNTVKELRETWKERPLRTLGLHNKNTEAGKAATCVAQNIKRMAHSPEVEAVADKLCLAFEVSSNHNEGFRAAGVRGSSLLRNSQRITSIRKSAFVEEGKFNSLW